MDDVYSFKMIDGEVLKVVQLGGGKDRGNIIFLLDRLNESNDLVTVVEEDKGIMIVSKSKIISIEKTR